jgi:aminotransferase
MPLSLSRRAGRMQQSEIRNMTLECARVGGINLSQGICDTEVPPEVRRAAQEAIDEGFNIYSRYDGLDELRAALARKMKRDNGLDYDPDGEIVVTIGATGAFYAAALGLLDPGDEVVTFEPYYGYHLNTLASLEVDVRLVPLRPPDWSFTREDLEAAAGPRTRAIVVNSPANPCGKVFTRGELELIGEFATSRDLFIFTDEVYEHFVFDGRTHVSPAALPGLRRRTIVMNALSKTFAVTGWRIGWLAGEREWLESFGALNDLVYVCAPSPLQLGAARGLERLGPEYYANIALEYAAKRDRLCAALAAAGLPPIVPQGAYYVLADLSALPGATSKERAMTLLERTGIAAVPGSAFYRGPEGHELARFCFGKTDADLAEACRRLEALG